MIDHYAALGVSPTAKLREIRQAYRRAVRATHPDMPTGDHDAFLRVQAAWEVLSDPVARASYDTMRSSPQHETTSPGPWESAANASSTSIPTTLYYSPLGRAGTAVAIVLGLAMANVDKHVVWSAAVTFPLLVMLALHTPVALEGYREKRHGWIGVCATWVFCCATVATIRLWPLPTWGGALLAVALYCLVSVAAPMLISRIEGARRSRAVVDASLG